MWGGAGWCCGEWKGKEHATRQASFRPPRHIHVKQSRSTPFVLPFAARALVSFAHGSRATVRCGILATLRRDRSQLGEKLNLMLQCGSKFSFEFSRKIISLDFLQLFMILKHIYNFFI